MRYKGGSSEACKSCMELDKDLIKHYEGEQNPMLSFSKPLD